LRSEGRFARPDGEAHNLFFGLFPDPGTRAAIADLAGQIEQDLAPGGRRIPPARYHMTLRFLGGFRAVPDSVIARARAVAARVRVRSFTLRLDLLCSFRRRHTVWWLGCSETPAELVALCRALDDPLRDDAPRTAVRSWIPHLTLRRDVPQAIGPRPVPPLSWSVSKFSLVDSRLGAAPEYRQLGCWPLEPASCAPT
jgi:2'-5' RNA ligase